MDRIGQLEAQVAKLNTEIAALKQPGAVPLNGKVDPTVAPSS
jgi:hypothetical protein